MTSAHTLLARTSHIAPSNCYRTRNIGKHMWYLVTLCHRDGEYSKLVFPNSWNLSCVCVHTCVCMSWGLVGRVAERNCKQWNKLRPATKGPVVHFNIEEFGLYGDMEEFHYGSYWHSTKIILERFSYRDREGGGKIGNSQEVFAVDEVRDDGASTRRGLWEREVCAFSQMM